MSAQTGIPPRATTALAVPMNVRLGNHYFIVILQAQLQRVLIPKLLCHLKQLLCAELQGGERTLLRNIFLHWPVQ